MSEVIDPVAAGSARPFWSVMIPTYRPDRDFLRQALAGDLSLLQKLQKESGDVVDAALDNSYEEISSQMVEVESRELIHIQAALARIDAGTYGRCESCENAIPKARLEVLPYATMCIKCQREAEQ